MTRSTGPTHSESPSPTLMVKDGEDVPVSAATTSRPAGPGMSASGSSSDPSPSLPASLDVAQSEQITKKSASNLALAFILLPKAKRDAMSALYAFCREVDDVADNEEVPVAERRRQLEAWRQDVKKACQPQGQPSFPVNRELQGVIAVYRLPFELFSELIRGCEMDLGTVRYGSPAELEDYCYRVASVVGLLSIEIFGYQNQRCRDYALHLGKALQLTNILRDVRGDAERGRIYLPLEDLKRFGVSVESILAHQYSEDYRALARSIANRAREFYRQAAKALPEEDRKSMIAAELMGSVYWRLLEKLERAEFNVFGPQPVRLTRPQKLALIARTWFRALIGSRQPNYG